MTAPGRRLFSREAAPAGPPLAYVVEEQPNPSTDYFVVPALSFLGVQVIRCRPDQVPPPGELADALVVFVRYVPRAWARAVDAAGDSLRRLVYFMDDDLLDWHASAGMPLRYRFKLARFAAMRKQWLLARGAELWVSTTHLQRRYAAWRPRLVLPTPVSDGPGAIQIFYHGTASHGAEIRWLRPVIAAALARDERLCFEIVGGADVSRLYRGLPRVRIVHPMKWPAYSPFLAGGIRDIGLAPMLDSPFNQARSFTKFMDITRAGAAGIYTPGSGCAEVVEHGLDGLVVPLDGEAWAGEIVTLARDPARRAFLAENAVRKMARLAESARTAYGALRPSP